MNPRGISLSADFTHHNFFPVSGDGLGGIGGRGTGGRGTGGRGTGALSHFHFTQYPLCKVYPAPHFGSQRFVAELYI